MVFFLLVASIEIYGWMLGGDPSSSQQDLQYKEILRRDPCSYCGVLAEKRVVDHIVPRRLTPSGWREFQWDNLTAACPPCNARKRTWSLMALLSGWNVGPYVQPNGQVVR